jgi:hypothetical protein
MRLGLQRQVVQGLRSVPVHPHGGGTDHGVGWRRGGGGECEGGGGAECGGGGGCAVLSMVHAVLSMVHAVLSMVHAVLSMVHDVLSIPLMSPVLLSPASLPPSTPLPSRGLLAEPGVKDVYEDASVLLAVGTSADVGADADAGVVATPAGPVGFLCCARDTRAAHAPYFTSSARREADLPPSPTTAASPTAASPTAASPLLYAEGPAAAAST